MNKILLIVLLLVSSKSFSQNNLGRHFNRRFISTIDSLVVTDSTKYVLRISPFKTIIDFYDKDNICEIISLYYRDSETREEFKNDLCEYVPNMTENEWKIRNGIIIYEDEVFYFIYKPIFIKTIFK
jgi:hypothetical protein